MKRDAISKRMRFEVFKRDGFVCQYCGAHPPDAVLEIDHIIPICEDGDNDRENLITACFDCNRGKGSTQLSIIPKNLAEKGAEIQEREEQIAGYRQIMQGRLDRIEKDAWEVADKLFVQASTRGLRSDWFHSIKVFNDSLSLHVVLEAAEMAHARRAYATDKTKFLYFCGICWNKIRAGQE